jgi:HSP20 family protein
MSTQALSKLSQRLPSVFDDFFKPWNNWFENGFRFSGTHTMPAVNIAENKDDYLISLAAPGMNKSDFTVDVEGNMITISCEKEEKKEEKDEKYNRKEYNYASFSRSFTLPDDVNKEKIDARYEDGVLKLQLPKNEEAKKMAVSKHIDIK